MKRAKQSLKLRAETVRMLTERTLLGVAAGQMVSSTGGDPRTCCWPDPLAGQEAF